MDAVAQALARQKAPSISTSARKKTFYSQSYAKIRASMLIGSFEWPNTPVAHAKCFVGIGLADRIFHHLIQIILNTRNFLQHKSFLEKTSSRWQNVHHQCGKTCEVALMSIVGRAQAEGDLKYSQNRFSK